MRLPTLDVRENQIKNARIIQRAFGTFTAATYLRSMGWTIEATMWILLQKGVCSCH